MPNVALAEKVLRSIVNHPEQHDQGRWFDLEFDPRETNERTLTLEDLEHNTCGTSACAAGWAMAHSGYTFKKVSCTTQGFDGEFIDWRTVVLKDGEKVPEDEVVFSRIGQDLLELNEREASELFLHSGNDAAIAALYLIAKGEDFYRELSPDNAPLWDNRDSFRKWQDERNAKVKNLVEKAKREYKEDEVMA